MNVNKININQSEPTYYIASDIYDVSAHNNGATFASLSALLSSENLSTLIPIGVRCGGMSIRFVQSSDNKYVQYRLTNQNWSTTITDWQIYPLEDIIKTNSTLKGTEATSLWGEYIDSIFKAISIQNSSASKDGILKSISFYTGQVGIFTIGIGHIENGRYVERDSFNIHNDASGLVNIDVINLGRSIKVGEQLFVYVNKNASETIKYGTTTPSSGLHPISLSNNGNVHNEDAIASYITWEIAEIVSPFVNKGDFEKLDEDFHDTIKSVKTFSFGSKYDGSLWGEYIDITPGIVGIKDFVSTNGGILKSITMAVSKVGTFTIGVGHLDQRSCYIEDDSFDIEIENTDTVSIDVSDKQIYIPNGDGIFVYVQKNGLETLKYGTTTNNNAYYGSLTAALGNGTSTILTWEITEIDSVFTLKSETKQLTQRVNDVSDVATTALNNSFKVKDRQGNFYRLVVVNGSLSVIPLIFSRALVIGNSITLHPIASDYGGWYADDRGMAATMPNTDFVSFLQEGLRVKNPSAIVDRIQAASWERTLTTDIASFDTLFADVLENQYDLIVFRLSENVTNVSGFKDAIIAMCNYLYTKWDNAEIIITSNVMEDEPNRNNALIGAATELGINYVDASCASIEYHPSFLTGQFYGYWKPDFYMGSDNELHFINAMFAGHPYDLGMLKIANAILDSVGYNQLDKTHNVSVNSAQLYDVQSKVVEGQIVSFACMGSIPSSANVSVKDSDNNDVSFTITDMTNADYYQDPQWDIKAMITFIAPNKDITITIS